MASVFIKIPVSERLPKNEGVYITSKGLLNYSKIFDWVGFYNYTCKAPEWFLEEIQLPTEEEIQEAMDNLEYDENNIPNDEWLNGANFILDKLKGGNNG